MHQQHHKAESLWHQDQLYFPRDISQLARLIDSGIPEREQLIAALRAVPLDRWRYGVHEEGAVVSQRVEAANPTEGTLKYEIILRISEDFCVSPDAEDRITTYGSISYDFGASKRSIELTRFPSVIRPAFDSLKAALGDAAYYDRLDLPLAERARLTAERYASFAARLTEASRGKVVDVTKSREVEALACSHIALIDTRSQYGGYEQADVTQAVTCELASGRFTIISLRYMWVDKYRNRDPYNTFILAFTDRTSGATEIFCEIEDRVLPKMDECLRELLRRK